MKLVHWATSNLFGGQSCEMSILLLGAKLSHQTRELRQFRQVKLNKTNNKDTFGEQLLTTLPCLASVYTELLHTFSNLPQKRLPNIFPNLPIFLHVYICHIRDILQLCSYLACLTNCMLTVVTFVFLCNISFAIVPQPFS